MDEYKPHRRASPSEMFPTIRLSSAPRQASISNPGHRAGASSAKRRPTFGASPHSCGLTSVRSKFKADDQDTTTTCCFGETPPETRLPVQPPPLHTIQWLPTSLPISSGRPLAATTPSWSSAPRPVVSSSPRTRSTSRTSTRGRSVCFHQLGWLRKLQLPEYEEETHR